VFSDWQKSVFMCGSELWCSRGGLWPVVPSTGRRYKACSFDRSKEHWTILLFVRYLRLVEGATLCTFDRSKVHCLELVFKCFGFTNLIISFDSSTRLALGFFRWTPNFMKYVFGRVSMKFFKNDHFTLGFPTRALCNQKGT